MNAGKRGFVLDLRREAGRAVALRLSTRGDVVLQSMRPGVADRIGIGEAAARSVSPDVLYYNLNAFGAGPAGRNLPGYDPLVQAASGIMRMNGHEGTPLARCAPSVIDLGTGLYRTAGEERWLSLAAADDAQWAALAAMLGGEAMAERLATAPGRLAARDALDRLIEAWTARQDRDALVARLRAAGIAAAPVQDIGEMWNDGQLAVRGIKGCAELPGLGTEDLFRASWLFSDFVPQRDGRGPLLGERNGAPPTATRRRSSRPSPPTSPPRKSGERRPVSGRTWRKARRCVRW